MPSGYPTSTDPLAMDRPMFCKDAAAAPAMCRSCACYRGKGKTGPARYNAPGQPVARETQPAATRYACEGITATDRAGLT